MNKPKWQFTKNSLQMTLEYKVCTAIKSATIDTDGIAILGEIVGLFNIDGNKVNNIFKALNDKVNDGVKVEFYISKETENMLNENMIIRVFMAKANVNVNNVTDFTGFNMGNKKFSAIVANPPYNGKLHLDIFEECVDKADRCVFIHPANWLQFPSRAKPKKIMDYAESFEIIDRKEGNRLFDIDNGDLVISETTKEESHKKFNWFEYHPFIMKTNVPAGLLENILNKIVAKCPMNTFFNQTTTTPNSTHPLRMCLTRRFTTTCAPGSLEGNRDPKNFYKITSMNYNTAIQTHKAGGIKFLNFNSEEERQNAWASYHTKFARFCVALDESAKFAPYMADYKKPWTDVRFYKEFELDDLERQLIEAVIV